MNTGCVQYYDPPVVKELSLFPVLMNDNADACSVVLDVLLYKPSSPL